MKKRIVMLTLALVLAFTACTKSEPEKEASGGEVAHVTLRDLHEVAKEAANDLEEAKKNSKRLHFEEIVPYCPDADSVYDIEVGEDVPYKGIDDENFNTL